MDDIRRCRTCGTVLHTPQESPDEAGLCRPCRLGFPVVLRQPRDGARAAVQKLETPTDSRPDAATVATPRRNVTDAKAEADTHLLASNERDAHADVALITPPQSPSPPTSTKPHGVSQIGRFVIRSGLGQGAFGRVYRAYDPLLDREVALKVPKWASEDAAEVGRFLREAKAAARLRHPNIVAVFESGRAGPDYFIASEFVEGLPLSAQLVEQPPDRRQAVRWVRDLAHALAYAHGEGIVHRDIKPANVMIDRQHRPQLTDFGLAKRLGDDASLTVDGALVGTPAYMAPEQVRGEVKSVGPLSDQYSLGVLLYELLTGRRPFEGPPHVVVAQVIGKEPPSLRRLDPSIPPDLEAIGLKALEKEPHRRYEDAAELADDLERWLAGEPVAARPVGPVGRWVRWCKRHPALAITSGLTAAGLVLATALGLGFASYYAWAAERISKVADDLRRVADDLNQKQTELVFKNKEVEETLKQVEAERGRQAEERRKALAALGRQYRERGVRLVEQGNAGEALLSYARALEIAEGLGDRTFPKELWEDVAAAERRLLPLLDVHPPKDSREKEQLRRFAGPLAARRLPTPSTPKSPGIATSPDGTRYVERIESRALAGGSLRLRDVKTQEPIGPIVNVPLGAGVSFSADGSTWLVHTRELSHLRDSATGEQIGKPFALQGTVRLAASDGKLLLTVPAMQLDKAGWKYVDREGRLSDSLDLKSTAWLWDAIAGRPLGNPLQLGAEFHSASFRPDGKVIIVLSSNRTIALWRAVDGQQIGGIIDQPTGETSYEAVARWDQTLPQPVLGPDGRTLAVGLHTRSVRLWDTDSGRPIGPPLAHRDEIMDLAFSPDGRTLATCGRDHTARLWDAASGQALAVLAGHQGVVEVVLFDPDGRTLTTFDGVDGNPHGNPSQAYRHVWCRTWNLGRLREYDVFREVNPPAGLTASLLSRFLDSDRPSTPAQWDAATGRAIVEPRREILATGILHRNLALSRDGKLVLIGNMYTGVVRLWDAVTGEPRTPPLSHPSITRVALSPSGTILLSSSYNNADVQLWDAATGRRLDATPPHPSGIRDVGFSPDGAVFLTARGREVQFWDAATGKPLDRSIHHPSELTRVFYRPDGKAILTGDDMAIRSWDATTGEPIGQPIVTSDVPIPNSHGRIVVSPDSRFVMIISRPSSGNGDMVRFYDAATGLSVGGRIQHQGMNIPFAFHPNGRMLLTGDPGKELRLWSVPDGRPLGQPIPQSSSLGMTLAFSPDGQTIFVYGAKVYSRAVKHDRAQASGTPGVDVITRMKSQIGRQDRGLTTRVPATGITRNPFDSVASPLPGFRSPGGRTGILDLEAPSSPNVVETRISTPRENNIISLWPLPSTYPDTVAGLTLWAQARAGAELDADGALRPFNAETWVRRRDIGGRSESR